MTRPLACLLLFCLAACDDGAAKHPPTPDLAGPSLDLAASRTTATVGATHGTIEVPFTVSLTGQGTDRLGEIAIANGAGTITIDGNAKRAFTHEGQSWPEFGLQLYQTLVVDDARWYVVWFYCNEEGVLENVYFEGTDGQPMVYEPATGTCSGSATPSTITVDVPATTMNVALASGLTANAPGLVVQDGQPGTLTIDGKVNALFPFEVVDCVDCAADGWYELHSIAFDRDARIATFLILYFYPSRPKDILAAYAISLPTLVDPIGNLAKKGTWSYDPPAARRTTNVAPKRPWLWRAPAR